MAFLLWSIAGIGIACTAFFAISNTVLYDTANQLLVPRTIEAATALQHQLQLSEHGLDSLIPPLTRVDLASRQIERSFPTDIVEIERRLWATIHLDPRVGHQVAYGGHDGSFAAVRRIGQHHYQISVRKKQGTVRTTYRHADALRTEPLDIARGYVPRLRPWYQWAVARGSAGWVPPYSDFVTGQTRQGLASPVYQRDGSLQGVVIIDAGIAPFTAILERALPHNDATAFLLNGDRQVIGSASRGKATTDVDPPRLLEQSPAKNVWGAAHRRDTQERDAAFRVLDQVGSTWAVTRTIDGPYGSQWQIVMTVPERVVWFACISGLVAGHGAWLLIVLSLTLLFAWYQTRDKVATLKAVVSRATTNWATEARVTGLPTDLQEIADRVQSLGRKLRTDALTGVLNRGTFVAQVEAYQAVLTAQSAQPDTHARGYALLFIDLNGFKEINDTYGHDAGDQVLHQVALRLKQTVRRNDAVSRFGGDEFVIFLHGVNQADVVANTCDMLRHAIEAPITLSNGIDVSVGGAIGTAIYPSDGEDFTTLTRIADERMYSAKNYRTGRSAASARPTLLPSGTSATKGALRNEPNDRLSARGERRRGVRDGRINTRRVKVRAERKRNNETKNSLP